jgi:hypothetical protein
MSDIKEVSCCAAKELTHITKWMGKNTIQQGAQTGREREEKIMGNKVKLIVSFPDNKPFWNDHNKDLKCLAGNFTQKWNKSHEHTKRITWMTKQIKKNNGMLAISFCPSCMYGKPWVIHSQNSYIEPSLLHKIMERVMQKTHLSLSRPSSR